MIKAFSKAHSASLTPKVIFHGNYKKVLELRISFPTWIARVKIWIISKRSKPKLWLSDKNIFQSSKETRTLKSDNSEMKSRAFCSWGL